MRCVIYLMISRRGGYCHITPRTKFNFRQCDRVNKTVIAGNA